jgi:RNA polymerase sigma-70 factor (ECF subfamily)
MQESNIRIKPSQKEDWMEIPDYEFFDTHEEIPAEKVYDEVMTEIGALPASYRDVLEDREISKLKYEEIAKKRNIKINTVRSRIHVAKKLVKNKWIEKKRAKTTKPIHIKNVTVIV